MLLLKVFTVILLLLLLLLLVLALFVLIKFVIFVWLRVKGKLLKVITEFVWGCGWLFDVCGGGVVDDELLLGLVVVVIIVLVAVFSLDEFELESPNENATGDDGFKLLVILEIVWWWFAALLIERIDGGIVVVFCELLLFVKTILDVVVDIDGTFICWFLWFKFRLAVASLLFASFAELVDDDNIVIVLWFWDTYGLVDKILLPLLVILLILFDKVIVVVVGIFWTELLVFNSFKLPYTLTASFTAVTALSVVFDDFKLLTKLFIFVLLLLLLLFVIFIGAKLTNDDGGT